MGLTEGLSVGAIVAPGLVTIGVGVTIGVAEMPGELFRIGSPVAPGLVPGTS